jgi:Thioredoxin
MIADTILEKAMSYEEYRKLLHELIQQNKTTGPHQTEELLAYARLNIQRMNRLDKQVMVTEAFRQAVMRIQKPMVWLVITEGWCGDAAQNLPVLAKAAHLNEHIQLKLILRDEHPDTMNQYLFNGTRSIPRLIMRDALSGKDLAVWGPRPAEAQLLVFTSKQAGLSHEQWAEKLHAWYATDKSQKIQEEIVNLLQSIA